MLDNETMYLNIHTIVFPDTKHNKDTVETLATKHNKVANYTVQALVNVLFANKEDAMNFYKEING